MHYVSCLEERRFLFDVALDLIAIAHIYREHYWCSDNIKHSTRKLTKMEVRELNLGMAVSVPVKERE